MIAVSSEIDDQPEVHYGHHIDRVVIQVGNTQLQLTPTEARQLASQLDTAADEATVKEGTQP